MVLLHMKKSDNDQFLFETTVSASIKDTIDEIATIHNLRHRVERLKMEGEELAKYGPAKPLDKQGLDEFSETPVEKGPYYSADPTGRRTGNACSPDVAKVLLKTLDEAVAVIHKDQVAKAVTLTRKKILDAIDLIRGAVMICYPQGLPEWDFVRQAIEDNEDLAGTSFANDDIPPENAALWFAGKSMLPEKKLSDFVGRHERTKAVVKLQKKGQGPPAREPVVDQDTQKAMMAWYYKKQEEQKKLAEDEDDSYASSAWASSSSLKAHFSGVNNVRLPK